MSSAGPLALACWGAFTGIPYWYAIASRGLADQRWMDARCKEAVEELPAKREPVEGIVLNVQRDGRLGRFDGADLVSPTRGDFSRIQQSIVIRNREQMVKHICQPGRVPEYGHVVRGTPITQFNLPHELVVRSITTPEDRRHRVEGIELRLIERASGRVLGRRVQFAQWPGQQAMYDGPARACPAPSPDESRCDANACLHGSGVARAALQPVQIFKDAELFQLHAGMDARRRASCLFPILAAPRGLR